MEKSVRISGSFSVEKGKASATGRGMKVASGVLPEKWSFLLAPAYVVVFLEEEDVCEALWDRVAGGGGDSLSPPFPPPHATSPPHSFHFSSSILFFLSSRREGCCARRRSPALSPSSPSPCYCARRRRLSSLLIALLPPLLLRCCVARRKTRSAAVFSCIVLVFAVELVRGWVLYWASFTKLIPPYFLPGLSSREPVLVFGWSALCHLWSCISSGTNREF
ncbi:hypothetical protein Taro_048197 [Colocasia esculenta]|uniref:Uncharacterized protein n=1 Tax=Colocasia esculenta TaxID=4460 RepID=A0A843X798_COLES|nr:hypothetical protein [Colocasia esculenta]